MLSVGIIQTNQHQVPLGWNFSCTDVTFHYRLLITTHNWKILVDHLEALMSPSHIVTINLWPDILASVCIGRMYSALGRKFWVCTQMQTNQVWHSLSWRLHTSHWGWLLSGITARFTIAFSSSLGLDLATRQQHATHVPTACSHILPNFHLSFFNSIETWKMFLFFYLLITFMKIK